MSTAYNQRVSTRMSTTEAKQAIPEKKTAASQRSTGEIKNVQRLDQENFKYEQIVGEGAFGIVRKCEFQGERPTSDLSKSTCSENSSDEKK